MKTMHAPRGSGRGYRKWSARALPPGSTSASLSAFPSPAWGCQRLAPLRVATPGEFRAWGDAGRFAPTYPFSDAPARFRGTRQGYAPAPRGIALRLLPPDASRLQAVPSVDRLTDSASRPFHQLFTTQGGVDSAVFGAPHPRRFYLCSPFSYGRTKGTMDGAPTSRNGVREAGSDTDAPPRAVRNSRTALRCLGDRTLFVARRGLLCSLGPRAGMDALLEWNEWNPGPLPLTTGQHDPLKRVFSP